MPVYTYIAVDKKGNAVNGTLDQPARSDVIATLRRQNFRPVSIKLARKKTTNIDWNNLLGGNKVKADQMVIFTRQLSAMVGAGVPLLRALNALADHIPSKSVLRRILIGVIHDIESGSTFGDALAKYPNTFTDVQVNMVRAGETAGILDDILDKMAEQLEKSMSMRKKIKGAMAYPMVLLVITIGAFFGLMIFIVPQIGGIVKELGGPDAQLPALTQAMLDISGFIIAYWVFIIIGIVAAIVGTSFYIHSPKGQYNFHYLLLKTPVVKGIVEKSSVARFTRTFAALIGAGVAVLEALDVTSRAVGNAVYEKALKDAATEVKNGRPLSEVLEANTLFPPIVSQMMAVGEETGQTDKIIVKVADFYEEEVDDSIASMSSIIEPVMIVIMGGMVGLIAASIMLPIATLSSQIK